MRIMTRMGQPVLDRKGDDGKFLRPGYGENSRVLAWIFRRCEGTAAAVQTPIGPLPPLGEGDIDTRRLDITDEAMAQVLEVDVEGWRRQLPQLDQHYAAFGDKVPAELRAQLDRLYERLRST